MNADELAAQRTARRKAKAEQQRRILYLEEQMAFLGNQMHEMAQIMLKHHEIVGHMNKASIQVVSAIEEFYREFTDHASTHRPAEEGEGNDATHVGTE